MRRRRSRATKKRARSLLLNASYHNSEYGSRRRRSKIAWAGPGLGDAFKPNLAYYERLPAQRRFHDLCRKAQLSIAVLTGHATEAGFVPAVKPQLSPCYTSYPDLLAAPAAIGLTSFLEFKARVKTPLLLVHLEAYLKQPAQIDQVVVDPKAYARLAFLVATGIQNRLLLEDLSRSAALRGYIECYRLFSASQQSMRFRTVRALVNAAILYGDVLPAWEKLDPHPLSLAMLRVISSASVPFFEALPQTPSPRLVLLGEQWVQAVCRPLAPSLTDLIQEKPAPSDLDLPTFLRRFSAPRLPYASPLEDAFEAVNEKMSSTVAPLNGSGPPSLYEPPSLPGHADETVRRLAMRRAIHGFAEEMAALDPEGKSQPIRRAAQALAAAITQASGPWTLYEDMRFDILEEWLRDTGFVEGPLQGTLTEGHEVLFRGKGDKAASGELFDRSVELAEDPRAFEALQRKARPITEALRKVLYPNLAQVPEVERFRTSGALDPIRLDRASFSEAIYKRFRIRERVDRRGRPVLLIACDGSGSLNARQMEMLKTLSWAWIASTMKSDIQVLAGLYHSGNVRLGLSGSLVQWIYHPRKTPAFNRQDALRAVVSLPNTGTGVQADALSLQFMLAEAQRLARDRRIYLIVLSDGAWNRSFPELGQSGFEEVCDFFEGAYDELGDRLHATLVALGVEGETGFEGFLDRVIPVAADALTDPGAVAADIGLYVASVMRERRRLQAR